MEWLQTLFDRFTAAFKWFWILQPWEQALRIRGGKKVVKFNGGIHFKIPYVDYVFKQNCRLRVSGVSAQAVTTLDGETITLAGALSYRVEDVEPLYMNLHMAEDTIARQTQGIISRYIAWHQFEDCSPEKLMTHVDGTLALERYGLADVEFILSNFVIVKTYRFITGELDVWSEHSLQTDQADNE